MNQEQNSMNQTTSAGAIPIQQLPPQIPPQNPAIPKEMPKRPPFTASFPEKLTAFLMFIPAYFYAKMICEGLIPVIQEDLRYPELAWRVDFAIFLVAVIALTV